MSPIPISITADKTYIQTNLYGYEFIHNSDGTTSLRHYNEKYNSWINLEFSLQDGMYKQKIIEILKDNYIEKNSLK